MALVKVEVIECDVCGRWEKMVDGEVPDNWYSGTAFLGPAGGGSAGEWASCSPAHIKKAVLKSLEQI